MMRISFLARRPYSDFGFMNECVSLSALATYPLRVIRVGHFREGSSSTKISKCSRFKSMINHDRPGVRSLILMMIELFSSGVSVVI